MSEKTWSFSPLVSIVGIKLLFLNKVELEEQVQDDDLNLVLKKNLKYFASLTLDLLQEDAARQEELKGLKDPKVFLWIILDEGKSRVLLNAKISSLNADD